MFLFRLRTNDCDLEQRCLIAKWKEFRLVVIEPRSTLKEFRWLEGRRLVELDEVKLVGWIDFEGTVHLAQDSVDVAGWKEIHYRSGPVRLPEHTGFLNEIISRLIKAIASKETKSWVKPAKWNVYSLQMNLYLHVRSKPRHLLQVLWQTHPHATKPTKGFVLCSSSKTRRD